METDSSNKNYNIESFKLDYRAIIPFYILLDPDLSKKELALYGLIEQMESCKGDVFYTNKKLAEILQVSDRAIRQMGEHLREKGYLIRELKLITIKRRKTEMHCWNTVKGSVIDDYTVEEAVLPGMVSVYTGEEAVLPGGEEAVLPEGEEAVLPPCKALDLKTLDINVCDENPPQEITTSHTQLTSLTSNPECVQLFNEKFYKVEVTIEEIANSCLDYYHPRTVFVPRFKSWIIREKIENYKTRQPAQCNANTNERLKQQEQDSINRAKKQLGLI